MIDDQDFTLDAGARAVSGATTPADAPKVVIVYRNRGVPSALVPPALILLSAFLILSHQRRTPIRVFPPSALSAPRPEPAGPPPLQAAPIDSEPVPPPAPERQGEAPPRQDDDREPVETRSADSATPPADDPTATVEPAAPEPDELPPAPARPRDRTAIVSNLTPDPAPPDPPPVISKEEALADVRREAERKEAEIRRLKALAPHARELALAELLRKAQANRLAFHQALRAALKQRWPQDEMADAIESLANTYGRSIPDEVRRQVNRRLKTSHARMDRDAKIEAMRNWGLPEPMVLDFLAHDLHRTLGTRGGPRSEDEVLIRAARVLLTMPPKPRAGAPAHPPHAQAAPAPRTGPPTGPRAQ